MKVPLKDIAGRININQSQLCCCGVIRRDRDKKEYILKHTTIVDVFAWKKDRVVPFASIRVFVEKNTAGEKTDEFQNSYAYEERKICFFR